MTDPTRREAKLSKALRELDPAQIDADEAFAPLLDIIEQAQARAYRAVNYELVSMYWNIGAYISDKAETEGWGKAVVKTFAGWMKQQRPSLRGFSAQNVWRMKQLYETYAGNEKLSALLRQTTWSNNLAILSGAKTDEAREFYLLLAAKYRYRLEDLERQIDTMLFERTMLSSEKTKEIVARHPELAALRDSYTFEFLELPTPHPERTLRRAIIGHLRDFILEFTQDFILIGEEYRLQVGTQDFFIDLLFENRDLNCLFAIELKTGRFKPQYVSQLDFYLEALDRDVKKPHENPSVGLVLCASKDDTVVEYALSRTLSPAMVAEYQLHLPNKAILQTKLREMAESAKLEIAQDAEEDDE